MTKKSSSDVIINFLAILPKNRDGQSGNRIYGVGQAIKRTNKIQLKNKHFLYTENRN